MAMKRKGMLIDIARCIGCNACSENCKAVNDLKGPVGPELSSEDYTALYDRGNGRYVRNLCRHCAEPACISVCPVSALTKEESGSVQYDETLCLGCRYCMTACTFRILTFEWFSSMPRIRKCILCEPRIEEGKGTGCAEACPTEATVYGDVDTLVKLAEARIAAEPEKYHDHIYGLEEAGGTAVMFISPVPFEELGFDTTVPTFPLPDLTWQILTKVPHTVGTAAVLLGGSYFFFKRRAKVAEAEAREKLKLAARVGRKEGE